MLICLVGKIFVQRYDAIHEMQTKFLHIILTTLAAEKLLPRGKEIADRNDMIEFP